MRLSTIFILILGLIVTARGCLITRFNEKTGYFSQKPYMMRNFDFPIGGKDGYGHLVINPRDYHRVSLARYKEDNPVNWKSKYGSVTFNLAAENFPQDGINEAGLSMQVTVILNQYQEVLSNTNHLPTINEMDLIQYVLDQASTVDEALGLFFDSRGNPKLRLSMLTHIHVKKIGQILNHHWGICDQSGKCALLEYLGGKFTYRLYNPTELFIVTNNDVNSMSVEYDRLHDKHLPIKQEFVHRDTFPRYCNSRYYYENQYRLMRDWEFYEMEKNITNHLEEIPREVYKYFFLLDRTTYHSWNKWQNVFDLQDRIVYFRTRANLDLNWINLNHINFTNFRQPLSQTFHIDGGELNQTEFKQLDSSNIERDINTISILMENPIEWSRVVTDHIRLLRKTNEEIPTNQTICIVQKSFEEQVPYPTPPGWLRLMLAEFRVGTHIFLHEARTNFRELIDAAWEGLY